MLDDVLHGLWWLVLLPFRLVAWLIGLLGRMGGVFVGFVLMMLGVALSAGSLIILGVPLFILGLLLTIRCLS
ncbi:MAG: hypothetical protein KGM43_13510 [Planctomycetota bacterium]|nr:hypothetical protein [Planctomycetota bacterium]